MLRTIREGKTLVEILDQSRCRAAHVASKCGRGVALMRDGRSSGEPPSRTVTGRPLAKVWRAGLACGMGGGARPAGWWQGVSLRAQRTRLAGRRDAALALKLIDLGKQRHRARQDAGRTPPAGTAISGASAPAANPFKFIVYSGLAGADPAPAHIAHRDAPAIAEPERTLSLAG